MAFVETKRAFDVAMTRDGEISTPPEWTRKDGWNVTPIPHYSGEGFRVAKLFYYTDKKENIIGDDYQVHKSGSKINYNDLERYIFETPEQAMKAAEFYEKASNLRKELQIL